MFLTTRIDLLQVSAQKQTLKSVTDYIVDVVCKRAELGFNYGVILIPEGLIDFIPEVLFLFVKSVMAVLLSSFLAVCLMKLYVALECLSGTATYCRAK